MGVQIVTPQDDLLALCLVMVARGGNSRGRAAAAATSDTTTCSQLMSFKCSVCGKAFSSYQALGGHKSSHRRPPPVGLELIRPSLSAGGESSGSGGAHQCNVCYRNFATGQALGGHKRCHYWDSSISSSSYSGGTSSTAVRDFDLNLPASEVWFDGEEVQSPHPSKKIRLLL